MNISELDIPTFKSRIYLLDGCNCNLDEVIRNADLTIQFSINK